MDNDTENEIQSLPEHVGQLEARIAAIEAELKRSGPAEFVKKELARLKRERR